MRIKEWLKDSYFCPKCKEGISQTRKEGMPKANNLWLKKVLDFINKHEECGVEL